MTSQVRLSTARESDKLTARIANGAGQPVPKTYLTLLKRFLLRPIQTDDELAQATAVADELACKETFQVGEEAYFDVLCDLIERYETETVPMPDMDAASVLRFLIEQRGVTQETVAKETGIASSTISAVLGRSRELTRKHIETLAAYFSVEPAVFLPGNE